jgi:hypothetical protein
MVLAWYSSIYLQWVFILLKIIVLHKFPRIFYPFKKSDRDFYPGTSCFDPLLLAFHFYLTSLNPSRPRMVSFE